ncbi:MAG: RES family NAD+ phosphorylase [Xanthobacteraceae bacterium]|nr:RES family NAD+ phosphorylase [Xanthobacteraceae bacterium]MBX9842841.1 RES family NAD+ phosphorylase [Xanthobacteraceae bacterium]
MRLWRISDFADLSGQGGLLRGARWHSRPRPLVYLADHPASALLEVLIHMEVDRDDLPEDYQLLAVECPDGIRFDDAGDLPEQWPSDQTVTQGVGDRWLDRAPSVLLRVPSAIVPYTWNWLFNPNHQDAGRVQIAEAIRVSFDPRLFG